MKNYILGLLCFYGAMGWSQNTLLLRQPTVWEDHVVFVYANDLWKVSTEGGEATRLTSDLGYESNPHYSNDGKFIAFSAQYDGNTDVFVIPAGGGEPQRLTFHPSPDYVEGWTPENRILFRSSRKSRPTETNAFYTVSLAGGLPEKLPIGSAAYGDMSPDGKKIAYTPITSWDPEWRNYRGGQAQPIWIVDLDSLSLKQTPQLDQERHQDPVWIGEEVYYLSERDYANNIWKYNPATEQETQISFHQKFDVKNIDSDGKTIVYEQGGRLHQLNLQTNQSKPIPIQVKGDMNFSRPRWKEVQGNQWSNAKLSPSGKRAIFEYRGDIFSVPNEKGSWQNLSQSPGVADRAPVWSPQGDRVAWFSDASGEYNLVIADQEGKIEKTIKLPNPTFFFKPEWSPDGNYLAFTDTHYQLWVVGVNSNTATKIDTDRYAHPNRTMNPVWSPDSKWVAYAKQQQSHFKSIFAYNIYSKTKFQITDPLADAISPVWSSDGKYIYTLGSTDYGLNSGWLDMSSYDPKTTRSLYAIALDAETAAPVLPESDREASQEENKEEPEKGQTPQTTIDPKGIFDRAIPLKLQAANYTGLYPGPEDILFLTKATDTQTDLFKYDISKAKSSEFHSRVGQVVVSSSRKNILIQSGKQWKITKTSEASAAKTEALKSSPKTYVVPREEYAQIFREGWRFMRDFLYVDNVHGAPWETLYQWYSPWVEHIRHRTDLNYLVDILSGEVAIGHSYVSGGDFPDLPQSKTGLLGCDLRATPKGYQITKILTGERWNPDIKAPLGLHGLGVQEGDYILSINGKVLKSTENPYALLEQTAGRTIAIVVSKDPSTDERRNIWVEPVASESSLRSIDWVEGNRRKVDELSGGKIAYVYVPNTSGRGFTSFNRYYFGQQDRKGVVVDERNNGGGSIADYMVDIMARKPYGYFNSRANDRRPWTAPLAAIYGPKVMLINERAGSGGDMLPFMFKFRNIGPLIGTKTWGGLVGTWDTPRFIDGGRMVAPRGGFFNLDGEWEVEGEGIAPDIEVNQHPKKLAQGEDPQLEAAVSEALRLLEQNTFEFSEEPEPPIRWKRPQGFSIESPNE